MAGEVCVQAQHPETGEWHTILLMHVWQLVLFILFQSDAGVESVRGELRLLLDGEEIPRAGSGVDKT